MPRYKLNIEEVVTHNHEVTIDTEVDIDTLCDKVENQLNRLNCSISDMYFMPDLKVVELIEDEGSPGEFEITEYDEVTE